MRTRMITSSAVVVLLAAGTLPATAGRDVGYRGSLDHQGPYVTGFIGGAVGSEVDFNNAIELDLESGWLFGATLGIDNLFGTRDGDVRVEAEVSHRSQDFDTGFVEADLTTIMGNIWYDFGMRGPLVPYAGGGIGVGFYDDNIDESTGFTYQFGGGANYHVSDLVMVGFNYRYMVADTEVDDFPGEEIDYFGHQLSVSLGYKF